MNDSIARLFIFSLLFNLTFPVMAYAFVGFAASPPGILDIALDYEDLLNAGIMLSSGESHNVTFGAGGVDFNTSSSVIRAEWHKPWFSEARLDFKVPSLIEETIGDLTGDYFSMGGIIQTVDISGGPQIHIVNSSLVAAFNPEYNWTRIDIVQAGLIALVTTIPPDLNNMTRGVYETGILTFTIGKPLAEGGEFDWLQFVEWYWGLLTSSHNYGLPFGFDWFLRILAVLFLTSAIMFARELIPVIYS